MKRLWIMFLVLGVALFGFSTATFGATLLCHYEFDEGSGTEIDDSSASENDGDLYNGVGWTEGITGYAGDFDGDNDYANSGSNLSTTDGITVAAWIRPDALSGYQTICSIGGQSGSTGFIWMQIYDDDRLWW